MQGLTTTRPSVGVRSVNAIHNPSVQQPQAPSKLIRNESSTPTVYRTLVPKLCSLAAAATLCLSPCGMAAANETVAEFAASGFIFKDTVKVVSFKDPGVDGVTLYFTDYSRSLQERLSSDPFADPSQASIACAATGPVIVKDPEAAKGKEGVEVLSELKTLNIFQNKKLKIRRVYDGNSVLYIAYSTRFTSTADEGGVSSSRYRTSICAIPVSSPAPALQ